MSHVTSDRIDRLLPDRHTMVGAALVVNLELIALLLYFLFTDTQVTALRYLVYPWIWINVGIWAIVRTTPQPASTRQRWTALTIAVGYFALLAYTGGLVGIGGMGTGLRVSWVVPGWGPVVTYGGELFRVILVPFKVVGYVALTYLVYATVIDAAGSAVAGIVGLFSCVSCSWPIAASLLAGVMGGTGAVAGGVYAMSYDLSTVVFVVSVGLLYWRPTFGTLAWLRRR